MFTRKARRSGEVRAEVARFEAAHPGIDAASYPNAFGDADGELIETEEFFEICGRYSVLARTASEPRRWSHCVSYNASLTERASTMGEPVIDGVVGDDGTIHLNEDELAVIGVGPGENVRVLPGPYRTVRSRLGALARAVGFTEGHLPELRSEMAASAGEDLER